MHSPQMFRNIGCKAIKLAAMFSVIAAFVASVARVQSQSATTGALAGRVSDSTGAVVTGAQVILKAAESGIENRVATSASGDYQITLVSPGNYILTVSKNGFNTSTTSIHVNLGTTTIFNVSLAVGRLSETVEVSGAPPILQTEDANISTTYGVQQIREVPNPGGDLTYIAQTAPGIAMNTGPGYGNFSSFGLPGDSNLFTINGNDYNDPFFNVNNSGASNLLLGTNEVEEVTVVSNAYSAQYGKQAGAQIDFATKSGTNSWHGNAVYNWTGDYLTANDPINKADGGARPFSNDNQYAASVGGPIIKDRLFFFSNYEGIRYVFPSTTSTTVPTTAFAVATLANVPQDAPTQAFYSNIFHLYSKAPGISLATPIAGSCAADGLSQLSNLSQGACFETWTGGGSSGNREWIFSTKVDYVLSQNDRFSGRLKFDRGTQPTYTDAINPVFNTYSKQPQEEGQLNHTHIFTPNITNSFIGAVLYYSAIFGGISPGAPALQLFPGNLEWSTGGVTALGFGSGVGGYQYHFFFPQGRNVTLWSLVDDLSITRGAHTFKMGGDFKRSDVSDFSAASTSIYPAVTVSVTDFFNDAMGPQDLTNYNVASVTHEPEAVYNLGAYFQDEFRVSDRLKLNLGARLERNSGDVCRGGCGGDTALPFEDLQHGADIPYKQSFLTGLTTLARENELLVFMPRFGVTYSPDGKSTVIRTGIGLFSDLYPANLLNSLGQNFPVVDLWNIGGTGTESVAWDLNPASSTAFPNSGIQQVLTCNAAFVSNYSSGGSLTTYQASAPGCATSVPAYYSVPQNIENPKYLEWNFEVQHALGARTVLSANYVGNRGFDETYLDPYRNGFGFGRLPAAAPDPRVGSVIQVENGAVSNYNGLVLSAEVRSWHGLSGHLNYTYSHALDDVSNGGRNPYNVYASTGNVSPYSIRQGYGPADYDTRHNLTASYMYQVPFKSTNRFMNGLIGGWQLSGTLFAHSGFPFTVVDSALASNLSVNNINDGAIVGGTGYIVLQPEFAKRNFSNDDARNCIGLPCFGGGAAGLNPGAPYQFSAPTDFLGSVVGRNAFRGPGYLSGDMSLRKNFRITERVNFQLGLNAYNFLNHANFAMYNLGTLSGATFGQTVNTAATPTSPYGAFGGATNDQRIAQIEGKITF
jgi:Carboxypeptidase regulatory-like domain/TonB-dependent Receptor Plug Domain